MDFPLIDDTSSVEIQNHDMLATTTIAGADSTNLPDDGITALVEALSPNTPTLTAFERQQKNTSNAISSLLLPCVASPIMSRRPQKRRTFGVSASSSSSELEVAITPTIVPALNDTTTHDVSESLWNNDHDDDDDDEASVKDDGSEAPLLSLDAEEEEEEVENMEQTWLSAEPRPATPMGCEQESSTLPSDLLLSHSSIPTEREELTNTPNSVSAPSTDDEHDSLSDHTPAPSSPDMARIIPPTTTTTTPSSVPVSKPEQSVQENSPKEVPDCEVAHSNTENEPPKESEEPNMEDILDSTDALFEQVTDKSTVTVKDILQSLAAEYSNVTFTKAMKASIRSRLVELITASAQKEDETDDHEDDDDEDGVDHATNVQSDVGDSDQSDTDESEADAGSDAEPSDDEDFTTKSKKKSRTTKKKSNQSKPVQSKTARPLRPKKPSAASAKLSLRVHAEQRRKRRLEELRVRNEELLLHQNAIDRERAEQIAAKFATNTEELRQERFEQRINLLQKLNHKRINACCTDTIDTNIKSEIATLTDATVTPQEDDDEVDANSDRYMEEKQILPPPSIEDRTTSKVDENDENSDDDESDSDDDEDELEIVGRPSPTKPVKVPPTKTTQSIVPPPVSGVLALLDMADTNQLMKRHVTKKGMLSPGRNMDQRALLREKLKERQRSLGNRWLARELGYKTEEEHLEVCLADEKMKRERIYIKEQERIKANERAAERMMNAIDDEDHDEPNDVHNQIDGTDDEQHPGENDDDEEMAMARELESEETVSDPDNENEYDPSNIHEISLEETSNHPLETEINEDERRVEFPVDRERNLDNLSPAEDNSATVLPQTDPSLSEEERQDDAAPIDDNQAPTLGKTGDALDSETCSDLNDVSVNDDQVEMTTESETSAIESNVEASKPKGPRNKAWQAILQQDAEKAKKKKRSQLVEEEADEEEEEEVAGLEDFGFVVHKKKGGDDDDDADLGEFDADDLEHVVDDLSDDEGDEQAGDKARKAMEAKEEKERHKEMLRRMRDGYDGRRGGIAGATGGARGFHRFDQLVAADNREDAKQLGLLNDDELDSDNEEEGIEKGADNEEDDEHMLLDKMLKARFLHRSTVEEENFSDDEGDEDSDAMNDVDGTVDNVDEEEKEQERLAKRFAKRARMQRLIEVHGHEAEFSESKLIDEDTSLKAELQQMKVCASYCSFYSNCLIDLAALSNAFIITFLIVEWTNSKTQ